MKTAEELFDKYKTSLIVERYFDKHSVIMKAVLEEHFKEALTEYRESIAKMIDEMIRDKFELSKKSTVIDEYEYQILALTELKEKLK